MDHWCFPLLEERSGDRNFNDPLSSWHLRRLSIPETRGRVRLQITIPFSNLLVRPEILGARAAILSLALTWQRIGYVFPSPESLSKEIIGRLRTGRFKPADRKGPNGQRLARLTIKVERWSGDIYLLWTDRNLAEVVPTRDFMPMLRSALAWTHGILEFCSGQKLRGTSWQERVYLAHRMTALLVADEIASLYLNNSPRLYSRDRLREVYPLLEEKIKKAYRPRDPKKLPRITARRLALALVDLKFGKTISPKLLLSESRNTGLSDSRLWALILPKEKRNRLKALCPANSVRDLIDWPEARRENNIAADAFGGWWAMLTGTPEVPLRTSGSNAFHRLPGVEAWATCVWDALYR